MDFDIFDILFTKVDIAVILAIMGLSYGIKSLLVFIVRCFYRGSPVPTQEIQEGVERFMPTVVMFLGVGAAFIITPATHNWRLWAMAAIYYAGAADLFYTFVWQTILNRINLIEIVSNLLLKWKERK